MIEVLVDCPRCRRLSRVEPELRSIVRPVCGHGTIVTPSNVPNLLQCTCGSYLDQRHIFKAVGITVPAVAPPPPPAA